MIDGFIMIILAMLGCIGLGVLLGWGIWGKNNNDWKKLYEKSQKNFHILMRSKSICMKSDCAWRKNYK